MLNPQLTNNHTQGRPMALIEHPGNTPCPVPLFDSLDGNLGLLGGHGSLVSLG